MHILSSLRHLLLLALILALPTFAFAGTTYTVNVLTDGVTGAGTTGSLRYCITTANATAGATVAAPHIIQFAAGGTGTITLTSNLPIFTTPIFIDGGTTVPAYTFWNPTVRLVGFSMVFNNPAASGSHLKGLVLSNANPHAIDISAATNNILIEECFIGTNLAGTADEGAAAHGIIIQGSSGLTVKNCIVSGNGLHAITATNSPGITVISSHIGVNKAGNAAIANGLNGVELSNACDNARIGGLVGGTTDSSNVISGNGLSAVSIIGLAKTNIRIIRNYIGVNKAGTAALANQFGINVSGITATMLIKDNVVSGSIGQGIFIDAVTNLIIKGNKAGTNAAGTTSIPNGSNSIDINGCTGVIVGGTLAGEGNTSSGTGGTGGNHGLLLESCNNCVVRGNYFGTNSSGMAIAGGGNNGYGIVIKGNNNIIGGTLAGEGNIISGNLQWGVLLTNGDGNSVIGNKIGVNASNAALGNGFGGIVIRRENPPTAINNIIRDNIIAYNGSTYPNNLANSASIQLNKGPGIGVGINEGSTSNLDAYQNLIRDNSIYCNAGLGVSLNRLEAAGRGNINKAAPFVNTGSTATNTFGTAAPGDVIQVFANPTACGCQGEVLLGTVTADGAGNWSLTHVSSNFMTNTANARDAVNNTSEFSICRDPTLPVEFVDFRVYPTTAGVVQLEWKVATEINNDYFTVEKSLDGIHFFSIGIVPGAGNSSAAKTYPYTDENFTASAYYRIKQTDFNGKFSYTRIKFLELGSANKLVVYPNPAADELFLSWQLPVNSVVSVTLLNTLSQVISTQSYITSDGFFQERLDLSTIPAGVYIVTVLSAQQSASVKIIKK